jgi:hypothetical protein
MHAVASPGSGYYKDVVSTDVKQADRKNCSPKSAFDFRLSRDHSHQLQQQLDASCLIKDQAVASWDYFKSAAGYSSRDDRVDEVDSIQRRRDSVDLYPITNIRSSARHFEHTDERQRSVLRTPNRSHQRRDDDNMVTESREFQHGCNDDVTTRRRTNSKHRYDTDVDLTPSSAPSTYREDSSSESVDVISASVEDTPKPGVAHKYQPEKIHSSSGGLKHLDALFQRYDLFSADKTADADLVNATETEMKQSSPVSRNREASTSSSVLTVIDDNSTSDSTPNKHLTKSSPERGMILRANIYLGCMYVTNWFR